jgi:hypothetical protein
MVMRSPIVLALLAVTAAACSGGGAHPADGGAGASGGGGDAGGASGTAGGDAGPPCISPLSQASALCASTFDEQVATSPCDAAEATQATCGSYKTWTMIIVGSQTCVYNAAGTMLLGAQSCGDTSTPPCGNCTNYGLDPATYAACTSAAGTRACPP